jgi:hypothetical protein
VYRKPVAIHGEYQYAAERFAVSKKYTPGSTPGWLPCSVSFRYCDTMMLCRA